MDYIGYLLAAIILATIGILGFSLNLIILVVIIKGSQTLWTPINVILVNLCIQDILVALLGNPIAFTSALFGEWYWGHATCLWYACLMSTLGLGNIGSLTVMAVERWVLIVRPTNVMSINVALAFACLVWIYAFSMSLPPLFGWGAYGLEAANISCSVSWGIHDPSTNNRSFVVFLFVLGLFVPTVIITASYSAIILRLKKIRRRAGPRRRRDLKVLKMVAIMIIAFLVAWTPYSMLALAVQFFNYHPSATTSIIPSLLAKTTICYNPIIYAGLNEEFMKSLKSVFGIKVKDRRTLRKADSNTTYVMSTRF